MWYSWGEVSRVISFFMRSSCFFSLPTSTHVGSAAALSVAAAMSASFSAIIAVSPAFAAFARNVPSPASGITPSSSTSVRSRQMALFAIFFMLFLLLFVFLFLFRPRQLFAADVSCGARPVMPPNGISGTPCAAKGTVSHRRKRFSESSIEFSEEITALFSASPLSSFVLFSPASAESRYSIRQICDTVGTDRLRLRR